MQRIRSVLALRRGALVTGLWLAILMCSPGARTKLAAQGFLRGDANTDGIVSISDILTIRRFLFIGGIDLPCLDAADADDGQPVDGCNCNPEAGRISFSDSIVIIRYLFMQDGWASILPEPFPLPGNDATPDEAGCEGYEVQSPTESVDSIRVGEVETAPGDEVEIPIYLSNSVAVEAVQLVIEYDPAVFTPRVGGEGISYAGTFYEQFGDPGPHAPLNLVKDHPEAGVLVAGIVGSLNEDGFEVPPGQDRLIVKIRGTVAASAPPGTTLVLAPTNGPDGSGVGPYKMRNETTYRGGARFATALPRRLPGLLKIVSPDGMDFVRGDANSDGDFDLSDAVFTLVHLFIRGQVPLCADAADTNDDGLLDISDPVAGLNFLFAPSLLESPLSATPGACGPDTRDDDLASCSSSACP